MAPRVLARLATALGRNDERPNVDLAIELARTRDAGSIRSLVEALTEGARPVRHDAIKTLYEIGARAPELIASELKVFVGLLEGKDNRMIWGAMCAIDAIASTDPTTVGNVLPKLEEAARIGSVITRDHYVRALVKLAREKGLRAGALARLIEELVTCPLNQLPMYAELSASAVARTTDTRAVLSVIRKRLPRTPQPAKRRRLEKVISSLEKAKAVKPR